NNRRRVFARLILLASGLVFAGACSNDLPTSASTRPAAPAEPRLTTSGFAARTVAGGPFNLRSGPGTTYSVVGTIGGNVAVTIVCQAYGTTVTGTWGPTNVWDKLSTGAWITDGYVYTGSNGLVAPLCGTSGIAPGVRGNDYPYVNDPAVFDPNGCWADPWAFCKRNCTSFVAWRLRQVNGVPFTNTYRTTYPDRWGNASNWGSQAQKSGIPMDRNPRVGDVAWFSSGHVAWVAAVNSDGTVLIEEYNGDFRGNYNSRTISAANVSGFIHIT
ncbi:MAG TPA: CHAP domain-containing protein, partial [Longimicrobiaceae bacterium]|nr:CHAP domain-containing protein [Longimicrobiaceae bacterium]